MTPKIGTQVHFVPDDGPKGEHWTATVTRFLHKDGDGYEWVDLFVMAPGKHGEAMGVREDQTGRRPGTWHSPEKDD